MATENEQLSTWLPPPLAEAVRAQARLEERSVSWWLKRAAEEALARRADDSFEEAEGLAV